MVYPLALILEVDFQSHLQPYRGFVGSHFKLNEPIK